jgi:hypothetical protein
MSGSLLCPVTSIFPARQQSGFYPLDTFDSAFRQNFDKISPGA